MADDAEVLRAKEASHATDSHTVRLLLATALGLGLSPVAPGTCGTLLGVLLHGMAILVFPEPWHRPVLVLLLALTCLAGILTAPWAMGHWRKMDPQAFVLDEVAGYLVVPVLFSQGRPAEIMAWGFVLFRLFDILKLPPARQIDRSLHGPWGIMLDDLVAGIQAVAVMYALGAMGLVK